MRKFFIFSLVLLVLVSVYFGLRSHFGILVTVPHEKTSYEVQKKLKRSYPLLEDQRIVAIVLGGNDALEVERNLGSIINQTYPYDRLVYIDNGSVDGTYDKVKEISRRTKKMEVVRLEEKKPIFEILYSMIAECDSREIVALIDGKDWLSHENVFAHLNCAYANPDVWMTYSRAISHPDYQRIEGEVLSDAFFLETDFRQHEKMVLSPLITFYAGFFKEIKLQDFLHQGKFIDECFALTLQLPLLEMGPDHILFMDEVSYVRNREKEGVDHKLHLQQVATVESYLRLLPPYLPLSHLCLESKTSSHRYKADVVLFSEDSPLELYACLESLFSMVYDVNDVYVLYQGGDHEFQRAYLNLQNEFHNVHFLSVCDYPGNDYATLMKNILENRSHGTPFVVFGTDHVVFEGKIVLHEAIKAIEKVHGDHFFLSFEEKEVKILPTAVPISEGIYAYQLGGKDMMQPFELALCRKSLFETVEAIVDSTSFKKLWKGTLLSNGVALFYDEKKVASLTRGEELSLFQKKERGHKFIEGFKIDLASLPYGMNEGGKGEYPLIKRGRDHRVESN